MRKPDFHRENPEQRISIVLGGVVLKGFTGFLAKNVFFYKKKHGSKKLYLRDSQNRFGIGFLADSENPSDHFFLKFPPKFFIWRRFSLLKLGRFPLDNCQE